MSSQVFRFPNRGNRGAMRGRQNANRGGRSPRIPASPKMVFTKEFVNTIEHSFVSSGGHSFNVLEGYEASAAKRIISLSVDIIVTGKVVVGDKYAANIAVGVRISDETPRNIGEVTKLHSYKVVSLPAKGQINIKPVLPGKQSCDLTDDDSELYVVCYADVDTVDGFDDPVGTMEIRTVIVYEPSPEQEWS